VSECVWNEEGRVNVPARGGGGFGGWGGGGGGGGWGGGGGGGGGGYCVAYVCERLHHDGGAAETKYELRQR